eukprot:TRINITY_DN94904_c0_g1_i1.p1 TRINITY_DN94904_c0_g1~~TRINITY_DN94904_c0_g1_i1.p1  ORF type:complete len:941 (-),score=200.59 TRINITY_DN94904_c0_g1_i1:9-2831(-)
MPSSSSALRSAVLASLAAASATVLAVLRRWRNEASSLDEETALDSNDSEPQPVSSELDDWLQVNGLTLLSAAFAWHGYNDLELIRDLSEEEVKEMLQAVQPRAGHAARLRRALRKLQQADQEAACSNAQEPPPVLQPGRPEAPVAPDARGASAESGHTDVAASQAKPQAASQGSLQHTHGNDVTGSQTRRPTKSLSVGCHVVLRGLERKPELNGCRGKLIARDDAAGRWELALDGGKGTIRVRPENIELSSDSTMLSSASASSSSSSREAPRAESHVPEEFRCCITRELMEHPVITSDGHTYERAAIAKWLEEHGTSPKTGQELPDKVLRPNHAMRAQIIALRERLGMPALPPWEPEPQETVATRAPTPPQTVVMQTMVMQTPSGTVTVPLQGLPGMHAFPMPTDPDMVTALLENLPGLQEFVARWQDTAGEGQEGTGETSLRSLATAVTRDPRLWEALVRWLQSHHHDGSRVQGRNIVAWGSAENIAGESALFRAVRHGECGVLERLLGPMRGTRLSQEVNVNGDSLLHVAAWHGQSRVASMLLALEHPIECLSRNRSVPLHYAAFQGHAEVVQVLLDGRADLERRMTGGDTALLQAAWQGHTQVVKYLLDRGAAIFAAKDDGDTALMLAAFRGQLEVCRELITRIAGGAHAIGESEWRRLRNHHWQTPLHAAMSSGRTEVARLLLSANSAVDAQTDVDETPLHRAVHLGMTECVRLLLEASANMEVTRQGDEHTALQLAVLEGHSNILSLLLEKRASVEMARRDGLMPLHMGVMRDASNVPREGQASVLAVLAEARANPEVRARNQLTPLHLALSPWVTALPHRMTALRALLDMQANADAPIREGDERPLHLAVQGDLQGEAALLLERRADVTLSRSDGFTPLHLAAQKGSAAFVQLLLAGRADPTVRNEQGCTPADVARQGGYRNLEQLLRRGDIEV